jgi:catechol 2,3-dioxygenase-like lactoylglutathione lyase family enzyme
MDWSLEVVVVPVSDVDRAKHFYAEQLGFIIDHDTRLDEYTRAVQLTPPGSACSIVIGTGSGAGSGTDRGAPGSLKGAQLVVADIETARNALLKAGVEVGGVTHYEGAVELDGPGGDWNSFIRFNDPDGNSWLVQQKPAAG